MNYSLFFLIFIALCSFQFIASAVIPIRNPLEVVSFEMKGRIRLIQELGRHWSIITGEKCFQVFDDNLTTLSRSIEAIPLKDKDTTKNIARTICDNDELFNDLIDQLRIEINDELVDAYKLKLKEYWTGVMIAFNEIMSELDINEIKYLFQDDEDIIIEVLSVQIDMISRKPEYQTAKRSIRKFLHKQQRKLKKVQRHDKR